MTLHDADTLLGQIVQKGVEPYSDPKYWYECPDRAVFPTPMSCPVTSRLVSQLRACCAGGPPILREQYFTGPPLLVSIRHVPAGADAHATAFVTFTIAIGIGSGTSEYDLAVVKVGNRWLVDDVWCMQLPTHVVGLLSGRTAAFLLLLIRLSVAGRVTQQPRRRARTIRRTA